MTPAQTKSVPDPERETDHDEARLRAARMKVGEAGALERRLAIASILQAVAPTSERPRLGRLEVQSRLGSGAMGVVYRAYDPQLGRLVAVKLLRTSSAPAARQLIADEARSLARLSDPNVVAIYDVCDDTDGDGLYFTMEYIAGVTLRGWLNEHPLVSWREVLGWFLQAGRGLAAAHRAGIVHRDFKPENVLVGDDGRARVVDFGLAQEQASETSGANSVAGTPYYMAPEVGLGEPATPHSDQYGFCKALADALVTRNPPAIAANALETGMNRNPAQRHPDLASLLQLLENLLTVGPEGRRRELLLERVERLWLRGVLNRSLGAGGAVTLGLNTAPELVDPPWKDWKPAAAGQRVDSHGLRRHLDDHLGSLLIVGPPGCGKTTQLLLLCRDLWRTACANPDAPAPAVLSLSTYLPELKTSGSSSKHFATWVVEELVAKYGLPRPAVERWLAESSIVLLLDGLDETDPALRARVVQTLNGFLRDHPAQMVVSCRDSEYDALQVKLALGGAVRVLPLDDASVADLVEARHALHLQDRLESDVQLRAVLRNPLLLTLYAGTDGSQVSSDALGWPRAYDNHVRTALAKIPEPEERQELKRQLAWLASAMQRSNTSDLWLERIGFNWLRRPWERRIAYGSGILAVIALSVTANMSQLLVIEPPVGSTIVFGLGAAASSFAYTRGKMKAIERLRWSWRRALKLLPITTICATVIGLGEALQVNFLANMVGAAITGGLLALVFALEPGEKPARLRPNAGIRRSLSYALKVSFGFSIPLGAAFALVIQPYITRPLAVQSAYRGDGGLVAGVMVGMFTLSALFFIYGGFTVVMYWTARLWLAWRTPLPLNLQRTLSRAADIGLMRQVGGGYVFLHRTLLDYFASDALTADETSGGAPPQNPKLGGD